MSEVATCFFGSVPLLHDRDTAVAAATVFAVTALLPGHSASPQPGIHLTAWTVVKHADGTVYVTIRELRDRGTYGSG